MIMHNPPHPGEFIYDVYMEPYGFSARYVAMKLQVSPSTFSRLLKKESSVTPEMSLRLSKVFGRSPESWLALQDQYDLSRAKSRVDLEEVQHIDFSDQLTTA